MSYAIPSSTVCGVVDKLIAGNAKPKRVTLGVTFKHDTALGSGFIPYEYNGEWRQIEKFGVVVESVQSGSVAYGKLKRKDFYDYWGGEEKKIKKVYVENWSKVDPA